MFRNLKMLLCNHFCLANRRHSKSTFVEEGRGVVPWKAVWNIKKTITKDYNIQSCQWMVCDRFRQPTQDHNVGYVKNIYLQPPVVGWISMWGCGKVQFERPFFLGSVSEIIKTGELKKCTFNLCGHQNN